VHRMNFCVHRKNRPNLNLLETKDKIDCISFTCCASKCPRVHRVCIERNPLDAQLNPRTMGAGGVLCIMCILFLYRALCKKNKLIKKYFIFSLYKTYRVFGCTQCTTGVYPPSYGGRLCIVNPNFDAQFDAQ